jgi:hypothetical protein
VGKQSRRKWLRRANSRCIFCEEPSVTKEHIWSEWMHPILVVTPEDEAVEFLKVHESKADRLGRLRVRNRQGSTAKKTVRVVCGTCNPGWMNDLEKEVRPVLEPLLLGVPVSLLTAGREVVARWITLKLIVGEHAQLGIAVVTQADRSAFMHERRIPDAVKIWIGQIDSPKWKHGWQRHAATLAWPGEAPPKPFRKNVQTTVFGAGKLLVFAMVSYLADYKGGVAETFAHVMPRLWPLSADRWPPERMVTEQEADRFAAYLDQVLRQRNVGWRPQPPEEA